MRLILLPGLDGTGNLFAAFIECLPKEYSATVVSYPTHEKLNYEQLKNFVLKNLPKNEPFALIAESFSGAIAVSIAAEAPQNLKALILCASFVSSPAPAFLTLLNHKFWFELPSPIWLVRMLSGLHDCDESIVKKLIESVRSVSAEVMSFRLDQILRLDAREQLRRCTIPLLVIRPLQDYFISEEIGVEEFLRIKPEARCVKIDASHFVLQHKPAKSIAVIQDFLQSLRLNQ